MPIRGLSRRALLTTLGVLARAPARGSAQQGPPADTGELQLDAIKVLTFDVGGTVFDWHRTVRDEIAAMSRGKGFSVDAAEFTNDWRRTVFRDVLPAVRRGELPFMNIDAVHRIVLDRLLEERGIQGLDEIEKHELTYAWHRIKAWPDCRSGLARLRSRFTVSGLSVLSLSLLVSTAKAAYLHWDALVPCEFLGHYKPAPLAYQKGVELLGFKVQEAMMVAAHPSDLRGARNAGLRTAYVPRPGEYGDNDDRVLESGEEFDVVAKDFNDLAVKLGVE